MEFIEENQILESEARLKEISLSNRKKKHILQQQTEDDLLKAIQSSYLALSHYRLLKNCGKDNLIDMFFLYNIPADFQERSTAIT